MIPIAIPVLAEEEAEAGRAAVLSGWVSQSPQLTAFEREFAAVIGAVHACAAPARGPQPVRLKHPAMRLTEPNRRPKERTSI